MTQSTQINTKANATIFETGLLRPSRARPPVQDAPLGEARSERSQNRASIAMASLTLRQREVMDLVVTGLPSKLIAFRLGISQRTVENHRAVIFKKTGSTSLPAMVRTRSVAIA